MTPTPSEVDALVAEAQKRLAGIGFSDKYPLAKDHDAGLINRLVAALRSSQEREREVEVRNGRLTAEDLRLSADRNAIGIKALAWQAEAQALRLSSSQKDERIAELEIKVADWAADNHKLADANDAFRFELETQSSEITSLRTQLAEAQREAQENKAAIKSEAYSALHDGFVAGRSKRSWSEVSVAYLDAHYPPAHPTEEKT